MSAAVAAPMALSAGSGILSAFASRSAGYNQASMMDKAAAEAQRQAGLTEIAGAEAVRQVNKQAVFLRGSQEEAAAGGGVASNTGSPLAIAQEDAREMKFNAMKTQFQYDSQAFSLNRQAQIDSWQAGKTRQAANMGLFTGLLTSGANTFYQSKGTLGGSSTTTSGAIPSDVMQG